MLSLLNLSKIGMVFLNMKYKDSNGYPQTYCLNPKDMLDWIIRAFSNEAFSSMKRLTKND